jgi:uncharacterized protein YkwD
LSLLLLPACNNSERTAAQLVTQLRASRGVAPLVVTNELNAKAKWQAGAMAAAGSLFHSNLASGQSAGWHTLGENVGRGGSVTAIQQAFQASPPHYADMVNGAFTQMGVGVAVARDGTVYVTQEFRG